MGLTNKQLTDALGILISKVDRISDRTKKHTKEIKENEKILKDLRVWIQKYVIAWSGQGVDMQNIMFKELDKVFTKRNQTAITKGEKSK